MIKTENGKRRYFDRNGKEITEGCKIRYENGRVETVYAWCDTENETGLGVDATNPKWIESGRAVPCEYGIYPLYHADTEEVEVIEQ
ncbi:MAG: hypothetical protein J6R03_03970 [Treponema sp.]|nr:hypothetical protein [Treponema sp.]